MSALECGVVPDLQPAGESSKPPFIVTQQSYNVTRTKYTFEQNNEWKQSVLILSDTHMDSMKCNRDMLGDFLAQGADSNSTIIINGDFYDAMIGPDDKRGARDLMRSPIQRKAYFDDLIREGTKFLHPFRHHIAMIGEGNHEQKVKEKHGTDLIERTIAILNERGGSIQNGRYSGFIEFCFATPNGQQATSLSAMYHHGSGIGSESKVIQKAGEYPDADFLFFGHFHNYWSERINRIRKNSRGQIYHDTQLILGVPGLKDDTIDEQTTADLKTQGNASEGWSVHNGHRSKPLGAWWVDFTHSRMLRRIVFGAREAVLS